MHITMIKKLLANGEECRKCKEVTERIEANQEQNRIDSIVYADVNQPDSKGFELARKHGVDTAPFFVVSDGQNETVYKTYLQLRKKVFQKADEDEDQKENDSPSSDDDMYYM